MKKILMGAVGVLALVCAVFLGFNLRTSQAQEDEKRVTFSGVMPFYTTGGYFGFFDQKDGTIYIYDDQMNKVLYLYKLDDLGKPGINLYNKK